MGIIYGYERFGGGLVAARSLISVSSVSLSILSAQVSVYLTTEMFRNRGCTTKVLRHEE